MLVYRRVNHSRAQAEVNIKIVLKHFLSGTNFGGFIGLLYFGVAASGTLNVNGR